MAETKTKDQESNVPGQGKPNEDDQQRGDADHGVAGANTGTNTGVPADHRTVDPHSEAGKAQREAREGHRQNVGGPGGDADRAKAAADSSLASDGDKKESNSKSQAKAR